MTDRDRQLDRLAKLLALESSPNVHEADAARRAAERLMKKHGLLREEASGRSPSGYYERPMGSRGFDQAWRFALVTAAARHCGAEAVGLLVGDRCKVRIAGLREDVERAVSLYEDLLELVLELGRDVARGGLGGDMLEEVEAYGSRECADAFRRGVVLGIIVHLSRASGESLFQGHNVPVESSRPESTPACGELVRIGERISDQSERVRSRYAPEERPLDLDVVSALAWFGEGLRASRDRVVVVDSGDIGLGKCKQKNRGEHGNEHEE
jgi:hypothetical protein